MAVLCCLMLAASVKDNVPLADALFSRPAPAARPSSRWRVKKHSPSANRRTAAHVHSLTQPQRTT